MKVLLVEDEGALRLSLSDDIREAGHQVFDFASPVSALAFFRESREVAAIVTDWKMPEMNGLDFLREAKRTDPDVLVIVMTAYGTVQTAVQAIKQGAYDYLVKPFEADELLLTLDRGAQFRRVLEENRRLAVKLEEHRRFHRLIGQSTAMIRLFEQLAVIGPAASDVLIVGETGTGKELVADAIHDASLRKDKPLVKVNCAILSREVLESELFGHERGAFTGASQARMGRFERAHSGSIYLDDVDDIPLELQVKLLRVLQERSMERVGSATPVPLDVRVIASTKSDLRARVAEGRFREDLFYRLNVVPVLVPPLRQRKEDIPLLALHFLQRYSPSRRLEITPAAMEAFIVYSWPGNVRELEHLMERLALTARGERIDYVDLPEEVLCPCREEVCSCLGEKSLDEITDDLAKQVIRAALGRTSGNKAKAAELLRIPPSTLRSKMEKYGLG
ncbi:MAG: sigma-54-dependent Fis family transcriptional regulator [Acidobacteria bacterium]|nr:sigma-54-dependent Fis family transcriptional regulator [Acidobacteriota bacterium]